MTLKKNISSLKKGVREDRETVAWSHRGRYSLEPRFILRHPPATCGEALGHLTFLGISVLICKMGQLLLRVVVNNK